MRLCTYEREGRVGVGVEIDGSVYPTEYGEMLDLIVAGAGCAQVERSLSGTPIQIDRLLAPLPRPGKMFGSGPNYRAHVGEAGSAQSIPVEPRIDFIKLASAVIGPGEPIVIPSLDGFIGPEGLQVDYEAELGVVIGKRCKGVHRETALECVFGYTLFNDVSARGMQFRHGVMQADLGKNLDTFAPMGPVIVTRDEIPDLRKAHISCRVNGELRQDAKVADLIFSVPEVIEWISAIITLEPGDCILTGTPAGVILGMPEPRRWLVPGDVVTVAEDTIGELTNPLVSATWRSQQFAAATPQP